MDYHKIYYENNKEKFRNYYEKNKLKIRSYYIQNREKIIEASREYNVKNKMKIKAYNINYNQIHKQELAMKKNLIRDYGKDYYDKVLKESYLNKKYLV
jgi:hypothetical protein